ncbi:MAG TPA: hypothetical protein PKM88_10395, partial [bacterium]|nr:hypothetical protein [bacterium]
MGKTDDLLQKETLTKDEVLDLLMERKRQWQQEVAPLPVTADTLRRLISEYGKAYADFSGTPATPAALQRLLAAVFSESA